MSQNFLILRQCQGLTIWLIHSFHSFWSFAWLVCYFQYFGLFHVSLIEIWLKSNPHLKIDHFPTLESTSCTRISWFDWLSHDPDLNLTWTDGLSDSFDWMDLLLDCYIILVRFSSTCTHSFVSIHAQYLLDSSWMPSPCNSLEACRGAQLFQWYNFITQYMDHL